MIIVINTDNNTFVGRFSNTASAEAATANVSFNAYFMGDPKQLETFTITQLASIYNSTQPEEKHIKKFSDKGVALDRTWSALKTQDPQVKAVVKTRSDYRCKYDDDAVIRIEADECPRRKKTGNGYKNWALYRDGMTIAEYLAERAKHDEIGGGVCEHLYWDVDQGNVVIEEV